MGGRAQDCNFWWCLGLQVSVSHTVSPWLNLYGVCRPPPKHLHAPKPTSTFMWQLCGGAGGLTLPALFLMLANPEHRQSELGYACRRSTQIFSVLNTEKLH